MRHALFGSRAQRKHLLIRTIRSRVLANCHTRPWPIPPQYGAQDRLAHIKFNGSGRIINKADNDDLILTTAKGEK
jgi:hypothetical protein